MSIYIAVNLIIRISTRLKLVRV